jgi:two-component system chemotaxis response regulator CheY
MKCLVVEDDFAARKLLQIYLRDYDDCPVAVDGREAVEAVRKALDKSQPYDLICLDIVMPDVDGYEILKAIRRIEKEHGIDSPDGAKVIMTTALSDFKHVANAFRTGCEAYLVKPIRKEELFSEMEKLGLIESKVNK